MSIAANAAPKEEATLWHAVPAEEAERRLKTDLARGLDVDGGLNPRKSGAPSLVPAFAGG